MTNIRPVSDLRNYTDALKDIAPGNPVFLTKNGRGKYVVMLIEDYERIGGIPAQPEKAAAVETPASTDHSAPETDSQSAALSVDDVLSALGVN